MKIAVITDTHNVGIRNPERWSKLTQQRKEIQHIDPDVLLHLGDVGETVYYREQFFTFYKNLQCTKLAIPGNHDFWSEFMSGKNNFQNTRDSALRNEWLWLPDCPIIKTQMQDDDTKCTIGIAGRSMGFDGTYHPKGRDLSELLQDWMQIADGQLTRFPQPAEKNPWAWYEDESKRLLHDIAYLRKRITEDTHVWDGYSVVVIATHCPMHPAINRKDLSPDQFSFAFGCNGYEDVVKPELPSLFDLGVDEVWLLSGHTHGEGYWEDPEFKGKVKLKNVYSDYDDPRTWVLECP